MDFNTAREIVAAFHAANPSLASHQSLVAVKVGPDPESGSLTIVVSLDSNDAARIIGSLLPSVFEYTLGTESLRLAVRVGVATRYQAHGLAFRGGEQAAGADLNGTGTGGWTIFLNGTLVCISNWHVLCGLGNETPIGQAVLLRDVVAAKLYAFEPVLNGMTRNVWDFALAKYNNVADALGEMRFCENGSQLPYPQALSTHVIIGGNETYYKVGNREPTCRTGRLHWVGTASVDYRNGKTILFDNQLFFSKMSDSGDSGAVIVRSSDRTVTGLNFAGNDEDTIANPLFLNPWKPTGLRELPNGARVPAFTIS